MSDLIQGYWFNPKTEKGLSGQPLGRKIVASEGCFVTYLIRSCRTFRPHWSESDVKEFENNIIAQIYKVIKNAVNLAVSKSVSFERLVYFAFGKCPLLIDDDLLNVIVKKFDDFIVGNGQQGLAFKLGTAMKNGQLFTNRDLNEGREQLVFLIQLIFSSLLDISISLLKSLQCVIKVSRMYLKILYNTPKVVGCYSRPLYLNVTPLCKRI